MPGTNQVHIDQYLSNFSLKAFNDAKGFIADSVMPRVTVDKKTDGYPIISRDSWLRIPDTVRGERAYANRVEFDTSTDTYRCQNYALAGEIPVEKLANADAAIRLRRNTTNKVVRDMRADYERDVGRIVTSGSNLGSYVSLAAGDKFSDYTNSDPITVVNTAHAFIEDQTGFHANTMIVDKDTLRTLQYHPQIVDYFKYTSGGQAMNQQLATIFDVERILVGQGLYNAAVEGQTASNVNIWGHNLILAYVDPRPIDMETATFGLTFVWNNPELGNRPMAVMRNREVGAGKRQVEIVETHMYRDQKVVAADLSYGILSTL